MNPLHFLVEPYLPTGDGGIPAPRGRSFFPRALFAVSTILILALGFGYLSLQFTRFSEFPAQMVESTGTYAINIIEPISGSELIADEPIVVRTEASGPESILSIEL